MVNAVVALTNGNGTTYEEGWAVEINGDTGQRALPAGAEATVIVRASDRPGNTTELSEVIPF